LIIDALGCSLVSVDEIGGVMKRSASGLLAKNQPRREVEDRAALYKEG
jgi:hypothetical protein